MTIDGRLDYESFRLADDEPCVLAAEEALRAEGLSPVRAISNGGLDANWMHVHKIPTVTLGCGQVSPHTVSERLDIAAFHHACRVALRLATGRKGRRQKADGRMSDRIVEFLLMRVQFSHEL